MATKSPKLLLFLACRIHGDVENVYPIADGSNPILKMDFLTLNDYFMILWSGCLDDTRMQLVTVADGVELTPLNFHGLVPYLLFHSSYGFCVLINDSRLLQCPGHFRFTYETIHVCRIPWKCTIRNESHRRGMASESRV